MAVYTTFDEFIASTNGQSIGAGECWDYVNLIWSHLGKRYYTFPPSNPEATNHGIKWGVLNTEARNANIIEHLTYITDKTQLKRGDIVITTGGEFGHGGFINEDYSSSKTKFNFYTQNYAGRRSVALDNYGLDDFGGAFRYDAWNGTPPTPTRKTKTKHYNWSVFGNNFRNSLLN